MGKPRSAPYTVESGYRDERETWRDEWPEWIQACAHRASMGEREYGDAILDRPAQEIVAEAEEELLDLAVYAYFARRRVRRLRDRLRLLEERS